MREFLVEVTPGREVVYRTIWALREAMRSGEITADSRIFHRASSHWLPITKHPEYRRFLTDGPPRFWMQSTPPDPAEWVGPEPKPASAGWLAEASRRFAAGWKGFKRRLTSGTTRRRGARRPPRPRKVSPSAGPPGSPPEGSVPSRPPRDHWTFLP